MKPIITLLASLACLASLAQALNHEGIRRLITEDPIPSIWYVGDTNSAGSNIDAGLIDPPSKSCVRPAFREDLIPGLPGEITSRYASRADTRTGSQRTSAATDIPHNLFLHEEGAWNEAKTQHRTVLATITKTPFTNVATGDNHSGCSTCDGISRNNWLIYHPWHEGGLPYIPATERWTITTVGVRHTATIPGWPGELVKEDITSCVTNREVLKSDWVNVGPTNTQIIRGGGLLRDVVITNMIAESITNVSYITPKTIGTWLVYPQTNDLGAIRDIVWQYDGYRKWNKDIEDLKRNTEAESKRIMDNTGESIVFVRSENRVPFDFKTYAGDIELGYKPDGTVTWRKTPERSKP